MNFWLLYNIDIHVCYSINWHTIIRGHTHTYAFTLLPLLQFHIRFAYGTSWITLFWRVMTCNLCTRYHTDMGALIADVTCLDESIELTLTVAKMILCRFQRPIGQRRVATPMHEMSYGLEIYKLQIQKKHDLSTQLRRMVTMSIPSSFQRPASQETRQQPTQSKSFATNTSHENSKATNRGTGEFQ